MLKILAILAVFIGAFVAFRRLSARGADEKSSADGENGETPRSPGAQAAPGHNTGRISPDPAASAPATPPTPTEQAENSERKFRKALAAETGDLAPSALLRTLAESAAQAWTALEQTRRVAEIYRDARLHDKALKLYVNTLKDYPTAALVASRKGDHALAAKLHTYVGDKDKALASWVEWGRTAANPLLHVKEMRAFGEEQFANVLVSIIETRPATEKEAEVLYRLGGALDGGGFPSAALRVFDRLIEVAPSYKDVPALRAELEQRVAAEAHAPSELDADGGGQFEALTLPTAGASARTDSDPPFALLELPHIDDGSEPAEPEPTAAAAPDASQTEPLVKTALASLALVSAKRRVPKGAVEEQAARSVHDDR